jgi:hypothetical protein
MSDGGAAGQKARNFARRIIALDTEMERRSCNPNDPGDAASWAARWEELVEEARALICEENETKKRRGGKSPRSTG